MTTQLVKAEPVRPKTMLEVWKGEQGDIARAVIEAIVTKNGYKPCRVHDIAKIIYKRPAGRGYPKLLAQIRHITVAFRERVGGELLITGNVKDLSSVRIAFAPFDDNPDFKAPASVKFDAIRAQLVPSITKRVREGITGLKNAVISVSSMDSYRLPEYQQQLKLLAPDINRAAIELEAHEAREAEVKKLAEEGRN
jgi:hypothetical protein